MKEQLLLKSIKLSNDVFLGTVVQVIDSGSDVKINISGNSMKPFLNDRDTIILRKTNIDTVKVGEIVLGTFNGAYVLHRMIRKGNNCIYIAGDNNVSQIEKINEFDIHAKATYLVRGAKNINLTNCLSRYNGLVWYYIRPLRKLYFKIFN